MADSWKVGDRVSLCSNGNESNRVSATVTGVDDGPRSGVSVHLDQPVNGIDTAYATHGELTRLAFDDGDAFTPERMLGVEGED